MKFDYKEAQSQERGHGDQSLGGMVWGSVLLVALGFPALVAAYFFELTPVQFAFVIAGISALMVVLYPRAGRLAQSFHAWIDRQEQEVDADLARRAELPVDRK